MSKNKTISVSVVGSRQEAIHQFLRKQDRNVTDLIWDAIYQVYWLPTLFDLEDEIDGMEKIKGAIDTIYRLEGEIAKARLLAREMNIDFSLVGERYSPSFKQENIPVSDRPLAIRERVDSFEESDNSRAKKPLPKVTF